MGYIAVVLLQTLVLPLVFGAITLDAHTPLDVLAVSWQRSMRSGA